MQPLITQLPEVGTGKSRSPTSNILLRSVDTRNHATMQPCNGRPMLGRGLEVVGLIIIIIIN